MTSRGPFILQRRNLGPTMLAELVGTQATQESRNWELEASCRSNLMHTSFIMNGL